MLILWSELAHTVPLNRTFYWFPYSKSLDPLQWEQSDFKSKVTLQYFLASFSIKLILTTKPKSSLAINSPPTIVPLLLHFGPPHPTHSNCSGLFFFSSVPSMCCRVLTLLQITQMSLSYHLTANSNFFCSLPTPSTFKSVPLSVSFPFTFFFF